MNSDDRTDGVDRMAEGASETPTADLGSGNPNRERPDVGPAQVSDDAIRENAARLVDEEDGAYAEE